MQPRVAEQWSYDRKCVFYFQLLFVSMCHFSTSENLSEGMEIILLSNPLILFVSENLGIASFVQGDLIFVWLSLKCHLLFYFHKELNFVQGRAFVKSAI